MRIFVDAVPLYDLGMVGELELLTALDGDLFVPDAVLEQVTVEPAATNLERFLAEEPVVTAAGFPDTAPAADGLLEAARPASDRALVAGLLATREEGDGSLEAGLVSEDRRLRAVADGLGATVTGTFGVVVRAAAEDKYFPVSQAKRVIRRMDQHGLQSTGPLRARAVGAIDPGE